MQNNDSWFLASVLFAIGSTVDKVTGSPALAIAGATLSVVFIAVFLYNLFKGR